MGIKELEKELLGSLRYFLSGSTAQSLHHGELLKRIEEIDSRAFLCGGAVRDILISKLMCKRGIIPRDLDIVLSFGRPDKIAKLFFDCDQRWNCYGGVEIKHKYWSIDVWSLEKTWAFEQGYVRGSSFRDFPNTTFLNIEAIVIQLFSKKGKKREIYSKGFFEAILSKTIEINLEENPNPQSCVVRALYVANKYDFKMGQRLSKYIIHIANQTAIEEFEQLFAKRYSLSIKADMLNFWIKKIKEQVKNSCLSVQLPKFVQLEF